MTYKKKVKINQIELHEKTEENIHYEVKKIENLKTNNQEQTVKFIKENYGQDCLSKIYDEVKNYTEKVMINQANNINDDQKDHEKLIEKLKEILHKYTKKNSQDKE